MSVKLGIPRALLYYYYYPMWKAFFESLGVEVVLSRPTNKSILDRGLALTVEDACLPIKLAFGHVIDLAGRVDYIFVPRLVSVTSGEYICPKFLGFPDIVRQVLPARQGIIDIDINLYANRRNLYSAFEKAGRLLDYNRAGINNAYRRGLAVLDSYRQLLEDGMFPEEAFFIPQKKGPGALREYGALNHKTGGEKPVIAVLSHPYNIYDSFISMNILKRLKNSGADVVTADQVPESVINRETASLPKRLFWTLGQRMIGAAFHFIKESRVQGILHVTSFGCGPDSMIGELIDRQVRSSSSIPLLNLVLDEHSGEAGVVTRLEAFLDMIQFKTPDITLNMA